MLLVASNGDLYQFGVYFFKGIKKYTPNWQRWSLEATSNINTKSDQQIQEPT